MVASLHLCCHEHSAIQSPHPLAGASGKLWARLALRLCPVPQLTLESGEAPTKLSCLLYDKRALHEETSAASLPQFSQWVLRAVWCKPVGLPAAHAPERREMTNIIHPRSGPRLRARTTSAIPGRYVLHHRGRAQAVTFPLS